MKRQIGEPLGRDFALGRDFGKVAGRSQKFLAANRRTTDLAAPPLVAAPFAQKSRPGG